LLSFPLQAANGVVRAEQTNEFAERCRSREGGGDFTLPIFEFLGYG
jgi:hypothetical protein